MLRARLTTMHTIQREFSGPPDIEATGALAQAFAGDHLHVVDLLYRFSSGPLDDPARAYGGE
jgi:hypothetical protein